MMREIAPFGVRIPAELKSQIEQAAEEGKRSMNSEVVARLEKSFQPQLADYTDGELVAELMRRYAPGEIYIRIGTDKLDTAGKQE